MNTCSCQIQQQWTDGTSEGSSTPSTCVFNKEDRNRKESQGKFTGDPVDKSVPICSRSNFDTIVTKSVDSRKSVTKYRRVCKNTTNASKSEYSCASETFKSECSDLSAKLDCVKLAKRSVVTCAVKSYYYDCDEEGFDETDRLIQLRNVDYIDIVDDSLKIAVVLTGYPKSEMRLMHMEKFQQSLKDILDMQENEGLLKKMPSFLDYYLNRGAIVCICKDIDSRDWLVRIFTGLQERMGHKLILLKTKVNRLGLAVMKTPHSSRPNSVQDLFKLLQYFNPSLKTHLWKIYSQEIVDDIECTSFVVDKISAELIRGSTFNNIIDYNDMEFELSGFTEIYRGSYLSDMKEDLSSVASRVKLLRELRSNETTPRNGASNGNGYKRENIEEAKYETDGEEFEDKGETTGDEMIDRENEIKEERELEVKNKSHEITQCEVEKDVGHEEAACTDDSHDGTIDEAIRHNPEDSEYCEPATSTADVSDRTEFIFESNENLGIDRNSNVNIDSNKGMAYHRRTNYLHVESELKIAIVLEGYPQNKLEGTHIRRFKHLFKEYLHKDMKMQRFANLIFPKFTDTYLSNGAVIYICDSLETKDYLIKILPKLIKSTGLKLTFRDINDLLRYTRIIMKLPKEISHVDSFEILLKLQELFPGLKPDCWKYYSDVAGRQKRQFGVDPESLEIIKSPDFYSTYNGEKIDFRIIDRKKRDVSFEESNQLENNHVENNQIKRIRDNLLKNMYCHLELDITNAPLARIRANHYSDLIADDLKLYVGPSNYPEIRIDEVLFHSIKKTLETIVLDDWNKQTNDFIPKLNDIYLFDGVIFVICKDMAARLWVENHIVILNQKLQMNLKATEFRGAVGIITMTVNTKKTNEEVIAILQRQNPRLRTKYWRKISSTRTSFKLDVVLQIDKLSAQVIASQNFNGKIGDNVAQFKLGHLKSLLNPKLRLEETNTNCSKDPINTEIPHVLKARDSNIRLDIEKDELIVIDRDIIVDTDKSLKRDVDSDSARGSNRSNNENKVFFYTDIENKLSDREKTSSYESTKEQDYCKVVLKVPSSILPDPEDGLGIIFDLLEDNNPGLNTELWKIKVRSQYNKGKFKILMDKQSVSVIKGTNFVSTLGGETLKFIF